MSTYVKCSLPHVFPYTLVLGLCSSRPCRTDEKKVVIHLSIFFFCPPPLLFPNLGCHLVILFVHLLSCLWYQATCPAHLHFDCFILMIPATPVCFLMAELLMLSWSEIFSNYYSIALWADWNLISNIRLLTKSLIHTPLLFKIEHIV